MLYLARSPAVARLGEVMIEDVDALHVATDRRVAFVEMGGLGRQVFVDIPYDDLVALSAGKALSPVRYLFKARVATTTFRISMPFPTIVSTDSLKLASAI